MQDTPDERVIKSYVWHQGRCFFVSTIERASSACADPSRYNETLVWDHDWTTGKSGQLMYQRDCCRGSIEQHLDVCRQLYATGELKMEAL